MTPIGRTDASAVAIPPPEPALVARFRRDVEALTGGEPGPLGVAVSGGADSLALLLLAWAAYAQTPSPLRRQGSMSASAGGAADGGSHGPLPAQGRRDVLAVSIDHGLRAEAADECRFVGDVCAALGVPHNIYAVAVEPRREGLQAAAREARLRAFGTWCLSNGVPWLMTGHHADDQAETVLMRIARGAGVGGLAGIGVKRGLPGIAPGAILYAAAIEPQLLRPLLGWRREELARIVRNTTLTPVADPSNDDHRFDRTRVRTLLRETSLFDPTRLAAVAAHCREADDALAFTAARFAHDAMRQLGERIELDAAQLEQCPREIVRRVVRGVFPLLGACPEPRGPQLMRLIDLLQAGRTATLAGIKATPGDGLWTFTRAPPRRTG